MKIWMNIVKESPCHYDRVIHWELPGLNREPAGYESAALTIELNSLSNCMGRQYA